MSTIAPQVRGWIGRETPKGFPAINVLREIFSRLAGALSPKWIIRKLKIEQLRCINSESLYEKALSPVRQALQSEHLDLKISHLYNLDVMVACSERLVISISNRTATQRCTIDLIFKLETYFKRFTLVLQSTDSLFGDIVSTKMTTHSSQNDRGSGGASNNAQRMFEHLCDLIIQKPEVQTLQVLHFSSDEDHLESSLSNHAGACRRQMSNPLTSQSRG